MGERPRRFIWQRGNYLIINRPLKPLVPYSQLGVTPIAEPFRAQKQPRAPARKLQKEFRGSRALESFAGCFQLFFAQNTKLAVNSKVLQPNDIKMLFTPIWFSRLGSSHFTISGQQSDWVATGPMRVVV